MARRGDSRLASLSLFAVQTDFSDVGELQPCVGEDQLDLLDDIMRAQGYLNSAQMGDAFRMPGSHDLIWNGAIRNYLLGEHDAPDDLLAWSADGPRSPPRMHIEYLRHLALHNDLAEGRFRVAGRHVTLSDLELPMFVVGTERDQVARWRLVFQLHRLNDGELTFALTSGGHSAGIVSDLGIGTGTSAFASARPALARLTPMHGGGPQRPSKDRGGSRGANGSASTHKNFLVVLRRWECRVSRRSATRLALTSSKSNSVAS